MPRVTEVEKHGRMTKVNAKTESLRAAECLCLHCTKLRPGHSAAESCPVASMFFAGCILYNAALMVTRCAEFVPEPTVSADWPHKCDEDCMTFARVHVDDVVYDMEGYEWYVLGKSESEAGPVVTVKRKLDGVIRSYTQADWDHSGPHLFKPKLTE